MLALTIIPLSPRVAMGSAAVGGGDGASGPFIDPDLIRAMEEKPDAEHSIIVVARLSRAPFELESMLPAPDEYNACTARWLTWEDLQQRCEKGEDISETELELAEREARDFDRSLVEKQEVAYEAHYWNYAGIVAQDVPQVLEAARAILGPRVRQLHEASQLLPATATRDEIEKLCDVEGIKEIWLDLPIEPQLDISRLSIEADRVHNGEVAGVPYTGAGVKVAVVDTGLAPDHPRLPVPTASNQKNFACRDGRDATDWCECSGQQGHGTNVAGIIFTQPDECCTDGDCPPICEGECSDSCDSYVGIAYGSTPVVAKMIHEVPNSANCLCVRSCTQCPLNDYFTPSWSLVLEGLSWAATLPSAVGPNADIVSCSMRTITYNNNHEATDANHITSRNMDWVVHAGGAPVAQAAGNSGSNGPLEPPSGAYNAISVANYNDHGTVVRSDDTIATDSCSGPTFDLRRKPDLCAPGSEINTTRFCWVWPGLLFVGFGGTSAATPHAAGVLALLREARPSLTPRQAHAVVVNSSYPFQGQTQWEQLAGWGQLNAYQTVLWRYRTVDGTVAAPFEQQTFNIGVVPADDLAVLTLVWHRAMATESDPVLDSQGNPSPTSLNFYLEGKLTGGDWEILVVDTPADMNDGNQEDNVRQVRRVQNPQGQPQYSFRVRVEHFPTNDSPYVGSQQFTVASRHSFVANP
ncbi:MAG: S8 family peptidase [Phycisphaerales bacterium]|nr:S8 family peptidase [Phycisphaerales bacterium]